MNGQDLKNSILHLAIQGKLVEQREEEGTARELLEQIEAEKKRLIKEEKMKKQKSLPDIKEDETPFDIPESWEWVRLIDLGLTQTGNTPSKTKMEYFGNFIPFISPGDILNGVINYENQGLSEQGKEVGRVSERNSILQVCIGGSIGKCAINSVDVSYNQQINAITPLVCNHLYVYYLMDSKFFLVSMTHKATGTATPIINKSSWESIIVPLPPLEEQKRIVAKIEELKPYVDQYDKAYSEVEDLNKKFPEDMQKSILQYAIQGKLVKQREEDGTAEELYQQIQEERKKLIKKGKMKKTKALPEITENEIPFDIPESWEWTRLETITYSIGNKSNQIKQSEILQEGQYPVVSQSMNRIEGYSNEESKILKVEPLSVIIFGDHSKTLKLIDFDFIIGADGTKIIVPISLCPKYLYYVLNYNVINMRDRGYSRHFQFLKEKLIPLPPLEEQKRIVARIEELMPCTKQLVK